MKATLAVIILGTVVLVTNGADARQRTDGRTHVRHLSRAVEQVYRYTRNAAPQYQSPGDLYGSYSQGHQPYPNPDRELYVNRSCCS
jgi:hypothetical protein